MVVVSGPFARYCHRTLTVAAGAVAYSKERFWDEESFDYRNKTGFAVGTIFAVTKAVFNSADNALVALRTFRSNN